MTLFQCTSCGEIHRGSKYVMGEPFYAGSGCSNGCGFVYHVRIGVLAAIRHRLTEWTPSLKHQRAAQPKPHDPLYGWNDDQ